MEQLAALFNQGEIIAFKHGLTSLPSYEKQEQQFFCINPLKQPGKLELANIAIYRNILIEMDTGTIEEQWLKIEGARLPWTTCVYSGGKSLHFIISIKDGIDSLQYYTRLAKVLCNVFEADSSVVNPNRLSRLGGSLREGVDIPKVQELIEVRKSISLPELLAWRFLNAPKELIKKMDKFEEGLVKSEFKQLNRAEEPKTVLPSIYKAILETGALHPECSSRHQSLVKFGVWLKENWHEPAGIEELLSQAQVSLGINEREKDLQNLIKWLKLE